MDAIDIPSYASRLDVDPSSLGTRQGTKLSVAPPKSDHGFVSPSSPRQTPPTPTKQPFNIPSAILASGISLPSPTPRNSRKLDGKSGTDANLLSTREPLSIPTTTTHFRRFAGKSGPIFWFQDRVEEVLMWKTGQKVTLAWMGAIAFLCEYIQGYVEFHVIYMNFRLFSKTCACASKCNTLKYTAHGTLRTSAITLAVGRSSCSSSVHSTCRGITRMVLQSPSHPKLDGRSVRFPSGSLYCINTDRSLDLMLTTSSCSRSSRT